MGEPYEPRQRAILFKEELATGATLGYRCTILEVRQVSIRQYPERPDLWVYRVYVPTFQQHLEVAAYDLFVTGGFDSSELPPDPQSPPRVFELRFDDAPAEDNEWVVGGFRTAGGQWSRFAFVKGQQPRPEYRLRMPVFGQQTGAGSLLYHVPHAERLDRRYVLQALAEIVCVRDWQESSPLTP